jgi:hypothetical protein
MVENTWAEQARLTRVATTPTRGLVTNTAITSERVESQHETSVALHNDQHGFGRSVIGGDLHRRISLPRMHDLQLLSLLP